ncbi:MULTISPECIES: UDP-N-acetylglucosamine 2-epimerase [Sulfurimonas]|uniref:UDP-N-acetylglucosamine 2-epimerase n=1 Tax=Sulfurimonas TaxID=202746 RepID=UPI001265682A|nr:UDP-N-acetylglucosamine 2-epimerase [Sulfurimonas indica]
MRKIALVTATRAEYGLLKPLIKKVDADANLELQLIVTGAHLSQSFGNTYEEIEKCFTISAKIPLPLEENRPQSNSLAMAKLQTELTQTLTELKSDIVVILGDRYEMLSVAATATILHIPIAHIHGGEVTQGAMDDALRHAITKLSHLHFTATQEYKKRVLQMGEEPWRVHNIGALGIENIKKLKLLNREEFEESIGIKLKEKNLLITYHPETLAALSPKEQFQELLDALEDLDDTLLIFTKANADTGGTIINSMIDTFISEHTNAIVFTSLGQLRYFSAIQYVDGVIGNSSSGILEVPSFQKPTINIGKRQEGRLQAVSVINVSIDKQSIQKAIAQIYTPTLQEKLQHNINPYESSHETSQQIIEVLKSVSLQDLLIKKFHTIKDCNE